MLPHKKDRLQEVLMLKSFLEGNFNVNSVDKRELNQYSPLVLAYVGDAVYEVFVRTMLVSNRHIPVHGLHKMSIGFVKAKAQSDTIHRILDLLTPEEQDVVRRGRNAKSGTIPKNADVTDYKYATGFEALIGYVYLSGNTDRLMEILQLTLEKEAKEE
jgi:ribonuclease-3 family protein